MADNGTGRGIDTQSVQSNIAPPSKQPIPPTNNTKAHTNPSNNNNNPPRLSPVEEEKHQANIALLKELKEKEAGQTKAKAM